jgi:hypothetical protein
VIFTVGLEDDLDTEALAGVYRGIAAAIPGPADGFCGRR